MPYKHEESVRCRYVGDVIHRDDLVRKIADKTHFVQEDIKIALCAFGEVIEKELADLNRIRISDHLTIFIDKEPGRPVKLHKLALKTNEYIDFAFYIVPKLSIEESYRVMVRAHLMDRISRGEIHNYVRRRNTPSEEENND
jgi:nucleoid DNA-binding protein